MIGVKLGLSRMSEMTATKDKNKSGIGWVCSK